LSTPSVAEDDVRWPPKIIAGTAYSLDHLNPFRLEVKAHTPGAAIYAIRVSFGFHCFTRGRSVDDPADLHLAYQGENRSFCRERYELSKELVAAIAYAARGRVYFSERANFLIVESVSGHNAPYVVFFNIEKMTRNVDFDAAMFVTSAHLRPRLPAKLPAISFITLVDHRVRGQRLKRPEPRAVIVQKRK
jgi:hypothetical protein